MYLWPYIVPAWDAYVEDLWVISPICVTNSNIKFQLFIKINKLCPITTYSGCVIIDSQVGIHGYIHLQHLAVVVKFKYNHSWLYHYEYKSMYCLLIRTWLPLYLILSTCFAIFQNTQFLKLVKTSPNVSGWYLWWYSYTLMKNSNSIITLALLYRGHIPLYSPFEMQIRKSHKH